MLDAKRDHVVPVVGGMAGKFRRHYKEETHRMHLLHHSIFSCRLDNVMVTRDRNHKMKTIRG